MVVLQCSDFLSRLFPSDMMSSPEGNEPGISGQNIPTIALTTFDELVGRSSMQETGLTGLADILNITGYA